MGCVPVSSADLALHSNLYSSHFQESMRSVHANSCSTSFPNYASFLLLSAHCTSRSHGAAHSDAHAPLTLVQASVA